MAARLDGGVIVDDVVVDERLVTARFQRCAAGWQAEFTLSHPSVDDLSVVHRLVAPSFADAKAAIPRAVSYLLGSPVDEL